VKSLLLPAAVLCCAALPALAQRYVATPDSAFPRIRYADSLDSANDRCIVAQRRLSAKIRPVYVNGTPIGFC
jgi:hypothetical protein